MNGRGRGGGGVAAAAADAAVVVNHGGELVATCLVMVLWSMIFVCDVTAVPQRASAGRSAGGRRPAFEVRRS